MNLSIELRFSVSEYSQYFSMKYNPLGIFSFSNTTFKIVERNEDSICYRNLQLYFKAPVDPAALLYKVKSVLVTMQNWHLCFFLCIYFHSALIKHREQGPL